MDPEHRAVAPLNPPTPLHPHAAPCCPLLEAPPWVSGPNLHISSHYALRHSSKKYALSKATCIRIQCDLQPVLQEACVSRSFAILEVFVSASMQVKTKDFRALLL